MVEAEYSLIRTEGSRDYILIATAYLCEHPEKNQKMSEKKIDLHIFYWRLNFVKL